jgi:5-methylcytosine-specific restriction endonuclease McrA
MFTCLVLTPWMSPHQCVAWQRAISMEYTNEIDVFERYEEEARSPSVTIRFPAVARLTRKLASEKKIVKFSRPNVYARDKYRCQYCGQKKLPAQLNYDHVTPRSKGGKTDWQNIVTSCIACNLKKGNKTLKQSGMVLLKQPEQPKSLPLSATPVLLPAKIPELWLPYLSDRMAQVQVG